MRTATISSVCMFYHVQCVHSESDIEKQHVLSINLKSVYLIFIYKYHNDNVN